MPPLSFPSPSLYFNYLQDGQTPPAKRTKLVELFNDPGRPECISLLSFLFFNLIINILFFFSIFIVSFWCSYISFEFQGRRSGTELDRRQPPRPVRPRLEPRERRAGHGARVERGTKKERFHLPHPLHWVHRGEDLPATDHQEGAVQQRGGGAN